MIELNLIGDFPDSTAGIGELPEHLGITLGQGGIAVHILQRPGDLRVQSDGDARARIEFERPIHFYRALGLLVERLRLSKPFDLAETPAFTASTVMLDASRNAVLKPDAVKRLLRCFALMGIDSLMLYTEDTYEVEGQPFFGYMRGRYSFEELKGLDDYAHLFGIEMIPCIQTLGHLTHVLKWSAYGEVRDTPDILFVGQPETYELLDAMIEAASKPFRSRKIHIGMDEAHSLGRGNYLAVHGLRERFGLMKEHLERVLQITHKHGLEPMIWSDMYFRLASKHGDYYDLEAAIPAEVKAQVPAGLKLVYWDYYHTDKDFYTAMIQRHQELGSSPAFAGGLWTWLGHGISNGITDSTLLPGLAVCRAGGVQEVCVTLWGDDGNESIFFGAIAALQKFAELLYADTVDEEKLKRRFHTCTGGHWEDFELLGQIDEIPGTLPTPNSLPGNLPAITNASKYSLYQDPLLGLFDKNIEPWHLGAHYAALAPKIEAAQDRETPWSGVFDVYARLCRVLEMKAELGLTISRIYAANDRQGLERIAGTELPELIQRVESFREAHRRQWLASNKPFGWEILDLRYGGLSARLQSTIWRIESYVAGETERIEELEEERLYFDSAEKPEGLILCNEYRRIVSASH